MGLDNGIRLNHGKEFVDICKSTLNLNLDIDTDDQVDVAYWRKYWDFRDEVISKLHLSGDGGRHKLDREDLQAIIDIQKKYLNSEYFSENDDCIWAFEEAFDQMMDNLIGMKALYMYWGTHPDLEIYFYDSF